MIARWLGAAAALPLLTAVPAPAVAWGPAGHRIVAAIAMDRLRAVSPATARAVTRILGTTTIAAAAVWPDTLRADPQRAYTLPWHFVDIPTTADHYDPLRDCKLQAGRPACALGRDPTCGDCIVAEMERCERDLRNPHTSANKRREALMFLVHFVGDLHQPLHCADDHGDHGGNTKLVCLFRHCWDTYGQNIGKNYTLHAAWDSYMIAHQEVTEHLDERHYAERLERTIAQLSPAAIAERERGTFVAWAEQSHQKAVMHAYKLPPRVKRRNPYDRVSRLYYPIGEAYFDESIAVIDDQLINAGIRLAKVLRGMLE